MPALFICISSWRSSIIVSLDKSSSALPAVRVVGVRLVRGRHYRNPTTLGLSHGNLVPALEHCVALQHFDIGCLWIVEVTQHIAMHLSPQVMSVLKEVQHLCFFSNWYLMHQPNSFQAYKQFPRSTNIKAFSIFCSSMNDQCLCINASDGMKPWWPE